MKHHLQNRRSNHTGAFQKIFILGRVEMCVGPVRLKPLLHIVAAHRETVHLVTQAAQRADAADLRDFSHVKPKNLEPKRICDTHVRCLSPRDAVEVMRLVHPVSPYPFLCEGMDHVSRHNP